MPPALLAGPWGLFVTSSKPLEVQRGVSAQLGSQAINQSSLEQQDATGREQEAGDLGSSPVGDCLARLPLASFSRLQNVYEAHIYPHLQWRQVK